MHRMQGLLRRLPHVGLFQAGVRCSLNGRPVGAVRLTDWHIERLVRYCFYPWERFTTERPNSIELSMCIGKSALGLAPYRLTASQENTCIVSHPSRLKQGLAFIPLSGRPGDFWLGVLNQRYTVVGHLGGSFLNPNHDGVQVNGIVDGERATQLATDVFGQPLGGRVIDG
jgi:hypothetical protein